MSTDQIIANRKEWCDALRSGQFKKTTNAYCRDAGSVDFEIVRITDAVKKKDPNAFCFCVFGVARYLACVKNPYYNDFDTFQFGITVEQASKIVEMNDTEEKSFNEIADHIESLPIAVRP